MVSFKSTHGNILEHISFNTFNSIEINYLGWNIWIYKPNEIRDWQISNCEVEYG
jgi:hypothetical protein